MLDTDACADELDNPLQKATHTCAQAPSIALARAHANVARLSEAAKKPWPSKTGDQLTDALAWIAHEADKCRLDAWEYLAELRAAACEPDGGRDMGWAHNMLARELRRLSALASQRRQAMRNGGAAELNYHLRMRRAMCASWARDRYVDRAEFHNSCLWTESASGFAITSIDEALNLYRADIWRHIADMHERRAEGLEPDPDAIADLRHLRRRIAELNAEFSVALAAARAEEETGEPEGLLSDPLQGDHSGR
jgi:hypothetical protein